MSSPTFNKTRLNFAPFDRAFGGIFFNRPTLIWGHRNSGKTLLAAQFVAKVIQSGERVCIMADNNPDPFFLDLKSLDIDVAGVINSKQLIALSCKGFTGASPSGLLPFPKAIEELDNLVKAQSLGFIVFHSALPWVAAPPDEAEAHVDEFVSATERFGITSLLTIPRPVSPAALRLRDILAERCPIVLRTEASDIGERRITVERYRGAIEASLPADYPVSIVPGRGFVARDEISRKSTEIPAISAARAAAKPHRPRRQALLSPTGEIAPGAQTPPPATTSAGPAVHPRHASRHHFLLNPTTIAPASPAAPAPAVPPAPPSMPATPAPTTPLARPAAPAPAAPRSWRPAPTAPAPTAPATPAPPPPSPPTPPDDASPSSRRHRFSSIIQ